MTRKTQLALLMDACWLKATDDISEGRLASFGLEGVYKVGFANALQLVHNARVDGSDRMDRPIADAAAGLDPADL